MNNIIEFIRSDISIATIYIVLLLLLLGMIITYIKLNKYKKENDKFLRSIGKGQNIQETIELYMKEVNDVKLLNQEIIKYCENIDKKHDNTLQKVGLIRYNAFQNVGSDLSFALALLDNKNTGIVLNGIYSRDMSNIYAKPVIEGKSTYVLTEEEKEAINKAMKS